MKKWITLLLVSALLTMAGCGGEKQTAAAETAAPERTEAPAETAAPECGDTSPDLSETLQLEMEEIAAEPLALPERSDEISPVLAQQALYLCTGHMADAEAELLEQTGFTVLKQANYDKADDAAEHTCAYTVGKKQVSYGGSVRTMLIIAVRGTNGGEWYSNFDFAPSRSDDAFFAENFLFAAEDVFLGIQDILAAETEPLLLICGHSRGAACANLLGVLLNAKLDPADIFVYTFATPATVRGDVGTDCSNIFNLLNPCDIVPMLPLSGWDYIRPGTDIVLPGDAETALKLQDAMAELFTVAPTISQYYSERHSLTEAGLSDDGMTTFEVMLAIGSVLADMTAEGTDLDTGSAFLTGNIPEESDFAPLFHQLQRVGENGGELGIAILAQHMPYTYQALIAAYAAQK